LLTQDLSPASEKKVGNLLGTRLLAVSPPIRMVADDDAPGGKEPPQEAPGTPFGTPAKSKTSRAP